MKTISGNCVSSKQISLSKGAKILSKFVSAENGASQVISAYLLRASASFNELNQLHKELKSPHSHKKKHKRLKTEETHDDSQRVMENSVPSVELETNQELNHGSVQSKNEFRRKRFHSENAGENADEDDEKLTQTVVKFSQELTGSIGYHAENVGGSDKHKKIKKKKQEVESRNDGDRVKFGEREDEGKLPTGAQNEIESDREQGNEGDGNTGMEEGKKQKREKKKKKKKDNEGTCSFSSNKCEVENPEVENAKGSEQQKETEKKLRNSLEGENGGLVGRQDLQIKKKRKYEAGSENKLYVEEVKMKQKKKRNNEDVEGRLEDISGDLTKKRMKRKHKGDP